MPEVQKMGENEMVKNEKTKNTAEGKLTGYPSIDRPWLKYYSEEAINAPLPECTMYQYIYENNKYNPSLTALTYYGRKIKYDEMFKRIKQVIGALNKMRITKGDIVTIMSMHTPETIYLIYALNYIGAVANIVYMTLSEEEVKRTILATESKALFVLDLALKNLNSIMDEVDIPIIVMKVSDSFPFLKKYFYSFKTKDSRKELHIWRDFISNSESLIPINMNDDCKAPAVIVYTSGTTGDPKGVVLSNKELNAFAAQDISGIIGFRKGLRFLFMLPPFIGFGIALLHTGISAGLEMQLQIDLNPERVAEVLFKNKTECFCAGPAFVDAILSHSTSSLNNLEYFICGGGEISSEKENSVNNLLKKCGSKATYSNGYGMTEASSALCTNCNKINKPGSLGIPFVKTVVKVVDLENGNELKIGETGELHFSSPSIMDGYYNNPEATAEVVYEDCSGNRWLRTGDLGYVDEDGFVFMNGRIKRIYYVRAENGEICRFFPAYMEGVYENDNRVYSCAVVAMEDKTKISIPIIFAVLSHDCQNRDEELVKKELYEIAETDLPSHLYPGRIIILNEMPITQSGKKDYQTLEKMMKDYRL